MASPFGCGGERERISVRLEPCKFCNRTFSVQALARHQPICVKRSRTKRRPFDSFSQRIEGTDLKQFAGHPPSRSVPDLRSNYRSTVDQRRDAGRTSSGSPAARTNNSSSSNSNNWRLQHEELIGAIRNARLAKMAMTAGQPLPPPPPPSLNPDYVQCPYCLRRFNESAARRHIPFCKERAEKLPPMKTSIDHTKTSIDLKRRSSNLFSSNRNVVSPPICRQHQPHHQPHHSRANRQASVAPDVRCCSSNSSSNNQSSHNADGASIRQTPSRCAAAKASPNPGRGSVGGFGTRVAAVAGVRASDRTVTSMGIGCKRRVFRHQFDGR